MASECSNILCETQLAKNIRGKPSRSDKPSKKWLKYLIEIHTSLVGKRSNFTLLLYCEAIPKRINQIHIVALAASKTSSTDK